MCKAEWLMTAALEGDIPKEAIIRWFNQLSFNHRRTQCSKGGWGMRPVHRSLVLPCAAEGMRVAVAAGRAPQGPSGRTMLSWLLGSCCLWSSASLGYQESR